MCFNASVELPAVYGYQGSLVHFDIIGSEGNGTLFLKLDPLYGEDTQQSILTAYKVAKNIAIKKGYNNTCNYKIVSYDSADSLEGPSGGAGFVIGFYSAITGLKSREDIIASGEIYEDGYLGPVGGIIEKAREAKKQGKPYFLTPDISIGDALIMKEEGIIPVEIYNAEQLINYTIYDELLEEKRIEHRFIEIDKVDAKQVSIEPFVEALIKENIRLNENNSKYKKFFEEEIEYEKRLLDNGHILYAGNEAFNLYKILYILNKDNFTQGYQEVAECLDSIEEPIITIDNFEQTSFALERKYRAKEQLKEAQSIEDLAYASAWCIGAKSTIKQGKETKIDQTPYKYLIDEDNFKGFYGKVAEELYDNGYYLASYYELQYVSDEQTNITNKSYNSPLAELYHIYALDLLKEGRIKEAQKWEYSAEEIELIYEDINEKYRNKLFYFDKDSYTIIGILIFIFITIGTISYLTYRLNLLEGKK